MSEFACRKCGTRNQQGRFCSECGARNVESTYWSSADRQDEAASNAAIKKRKQGSSSKPAAFRVAALTRQSELNLGTLVISFSCIFVIAVAGGFAVKPILATIKNQQLWKDYETSRKSDRISLANELSKTADSSTNSEQKEAESSPESEEFPVGAVFEIAATTDNAFLLFSDLYALKEYLSAERAGDNEGISKMSSRRVLWVMEKVQVRVLEDDSRAQHIGLLKVRVIGAGHGYDRDPAGFVYISQLRKFFQK